MPYSMVGASTLGFDLARLPQGDHVALVIRTALRCGPHEIEKLAARHPGPTRDERWSTVVAEHDPGADGASASAAEDGSTGLDGSAFVSRLGDSAIGSLRDLDRLIRTEILDWTWLHSGDLSVQDPTACRAADVLVDAAASAFVAATAPRPVRRMMVAPYLVARLCLVDQAAGTGHAEVDRMLATLGGADGRVRTSWRAAVDAHWAGVTDWAPAMHRATWVLSVTERLRLAMDAQMAAVTAFVGAGFQGRDAAHGVWNAWSGAVQATAAADLLGLEDMTTLMRVYRRAHGQEAWLPHL